MNITLQAVCRLIGAECPPGRETVEMRGIAALDEAGPGDISFLSNQKYWKHLTQTRAGAVIVSPEAELPPSVVPLRVRDPYFAFLQVLELFNSRTPGIMASGVHAQAVVSSTARLGRNVSVGPFAVIGEHVTIGAGTIVGPCSVVLDGSILGEQCVLFPNVTIMDGCTLGNRVTLHAGVVVGSDGFGFAPHGGKYHKISQIGTVRVGDDVEIGANTCIDRAAFGTTVIENGTKIDNLVQVAHNVRIGENTVIASQTGISGSTTIGKWVRLGGQAGLAGHLDVGDGAAVGAQAGVTKDVPPGETVSGYPAKNHMQAMRLEAALRHLPDLMKRIKEQEKRISELEQMVKERS